MKDLLARAKRKFIYNAKPRAITQTLSSRSLFIVGHARSGTTILADALNLHPEIFLSTEAYYFLAKDLSNFIQEYNRMHLKTLANPLSKSTYMPLLPNKRDNYWYDFLQEIAKYHRWIGDKLAFHHYHAFPHGLQNFTEFQADYFYDASYIHIIRDPIATVISTQKLLPAPTILMHAKSWLLTIKNWIRMVTFFPNNYSILHESLSLSTVNQLFDCLELETVIKTDLFKKKHIRKHELTEIDNRESVEILESMDAIYKTLRKLVPENLHEFDITLKMHHSDLHLLDKSCDEVLAEINNISPGTCIEISDK